MDTPHDAAEPDPFCLTAEESDLLHRVACTLVEATARGGQASVSDHPLGRLMDFPVVGAFVTLRKQGELRGCIGNFTDATPLAQALERAAVGVVRHDRRFAPVTADELTHLTLSVSILHTRELIQGSPQQRIAQVVVGQHGLDIQLQGRKGLLLPSVATDFDLDAVGFLQAVCRKADLPDDAWKDSDATLYRFSTIGLGGPCAAS